MKNKAVDWFLSELIKEQYIKRLPVIEYKKAKLIEEGIITPEDKLSIRQLENLYSKTFNTKEK